MKYKNILDDFIDIFLNLIYPRNIYCICCEKPIHKTEKYSMCHQCRNCVQFIRGKVCEKCGKPLDAFYISRECPDCIHSPHYFTKGISCAVYDDIIREWVHRLKYKGQGYLAYHMAEIMVDRWIEEDIDTIDVIVPVPLYKKKENIRGFNQSYLIGKDMAKAMGWGIDRKNLIKIRDTKDQHKLLKDERNTNLNGSFSIMDKDIFHNKNILLVDDVYTTGSTMDACAKVLLDCSPRNIYMMTFATGRNI